ncbi:hypothetical protein PAEPH01_0805 [Pancytospora epiphaga]|nr:hypothetical protein PAEPH01_0805 [Pancytospora epiphaga]
MRGDEMIKSENSQIEILSHEDKQVLSLAKTKFTCGICLYFTTDATITPCGHIFCSECITGWITSIFPDVKCPTCRLIFKMEQTFRMYNTSTSRCWRSYAWKKIMEPEFSFKYRKIRNILIYKEDFLDSLSLKAVMILVVAFLLVSFVFLSIINV